MSLKRQPAGELGAADAGRRVLLRGWVGRRRDLGELVFLTVRDRSGIVQVLFDRARSGEEAAVRAGDARPEDVVEIEGEVVRRADAQINREIPTGEIEIVATRLEFLARAETPPFLPEDRTNATEELRLEHRYIDLRRPVMFKNLKLRHEIAFRVRQTLHQLGFLEVETPMLTKSTPEGARDYLVPSRVHPGKFYALPQSPQLFKQILMVSGFERYFQITRCFRDEDLRLDRQPEFTQIDLEMSFTTEEEVFAVVEEILAAAFGAAEIEVERPFMRLTYPEAMLRYGTDRPDLRFDLPIVDLCAEAKASQFPPFVSALLINGYVRGLRVPAGATFSRKKLDDLTEIAKSHGAKTLYWIKKANDEVSSPLKKQVSEQSLLHWLSAAQVLDGDLLLIVADAAEAVLSSLAELRLSVARDLNLIDRSRYVFTWVTDFPLFGWDHVSQHWFPMNHPFTSPREEDLSLIDSEPGKARARAYDVVLNGRELGSGSIRIHRADVQERVFRALGISEAEGRERFGFLLDALRYGAPPHGGIAMGLDRICMLAAGASSLRDVIAFPKTTSGSDLMTGSPSRVDPAQLEDLAITVVRPPES